MNVIQANEITFHPHSFADQRVRLFTWNEKFYRAISSDYANFYRQLFDENIILSAVEKGLLVESEPTSLLVDGYELVIRHRRIRFQSYPNEWCPAMLRDGALTIVDLALDLARHGYTLGDAHPWNLLFDLESMRPIFVDLGSVVPITEFTWSLYDEFCRFCLYPLVLMSQGEDHLARLLMWEDSGVTELDIRKLRGISIPFLLTRYRSLLNRAERAFAQRVPESYRDWLRHACNSAPVSVLQSSNNCGISRHRSGNLRYKLHLRFLEKVRRDVQRIRILSGKNHTRKASKIQKLSTTPQHDWTATQCFLHKLLTKLQPRTLLDVGSDTAWCAKLAAALGIQVVRWDTDPMRVTQLYRDARESKLPMLPVVMDFTKPTPARGLANHWSIPATDRFQCDMALALGMLHRVVRDRRLSFDQIIDGLASLATRWVVVEFSVGEHETPRERLAPPSWYALDNFVSAARKRFREVRVVLPGEKSQLLLCEK